MKPGRVNLTGVADPAEAIGRALDVRLREARDLEGALVAREPRALHAFRVACKRLRYALDRVETPPGAAVPPFECLAELQDALGQARDCDVLLGVLPPTMKQTQRRLLEKRQAHVDRARALWERTRDLVPLAVSHRIQRAL